jgi:hypothetical protein
MQYRISHSVLVVSIPLLMLMTTQIGIANQASSRMAKMQGHGVTDEQQKRADDLLNDPIFRLMPFALAGCFLGSFACVGIRRIHSRSEAARYFGVSVVLGLASVCGSFYLEFFKEPRWYGVFAVSVILSLVSWFVMEIFNILGGWVKKAAEDRGIEGVRDQIILILSFGLIGSRKKKE